MQLRATNDMLGSYFFVHYTPHIVFITPGFVEAGASFTFREETQVHIGLAAEMISGEFMAGLKDARLARLRDALFSIVHTSLRKGG